MCWLSACQLIVSVFCLKHMVSDQVREVDCSMMLAVEDRLGSTVQDSHRSSLFLLGRVTDGDGASATIFGLPVDSAVYARYIGHVRDAIRINRQGYWHSDIPSPFRIGSRTARHGDAWRTRSFHKVEVVDDSVWILL